MFLGDLIDRGPESREVIVRAMCAVASGEAVAIKGNHEALMLHVYGHDESIGVYHWAVNSGDETIASYKDANGDYSDWRDAIDNDHLKWMRNLPTMIRDEERGLVFVHGGIDPKTFPNCGDEIRLWTRSHKFFKTRTWPQRLEVANILVVHGHTPTDNFEPEQEPRRINVDTGACFGGPLTCVALAKNAAPRFLSAGSW